MQNDNLRDEERVQLISLSGGERSAFDYFYRKYSKLIYQKLHYMLKSTELAEELLQDVFVKVWVKRAEIDENLSFKSWLLTIAQNLVYDYFRRLALDSKMQQHLIHTFSEYYNQTEDYLLNKERRAILDQAIAQLSPQRKEIFKLCRVEGRSYKEVAEILKISPSTVSNQLVSATKTVKDYVFFHSGEFFVIYLALFFGS